MKFVHAADLHLDSPLRGLERYEGAPVDRIREASREACRNLVELCTSSHADFLLIAGDIYDGDWKDFTTGLFFAQQMSRLRERGIPVYVVQGNHDAASVITRQLRLPDNVRVFSTQHAETVIDASGAAIHGRGFATRAVTEDLTAGYPEKVPDCFNIGLLHTSLDGRPGHASYAPTHADALRSKGYDYWALGHVHAREVVRTDPWIVFPGNLQGRHIREPGPKGASVVTVEDERVCAVEHCTLDVVRWTHLRLDVGDCLSAQDVIEEVHEALAHAVAQAEGRLLASRITVEGKTRAHENLLREAERWENDIRAIANDVGDIWVERVRWRTSSWVDLSELGARQDAVGELVQSLQSLPERPEGIAELAPLLEDLRRKLPAAARQGPEGVLADEPEYLRGVLQDVKQLLLSRMTASLEVE